MITYTFTFTQLETVMVLQALRYMQSMPDIEVSRLDKREAELIREGMKQSIKSQEGHYGTNKGISATDPRAIQDH